MTRIRGYVWRRSDLFESSRLVVVLTPDEGRIHVLVKGAHRPASDALGKLDLLNLIEADLAGRPGTLRSATRLRLLHEARALREPARFLAISHVQELLDGALLDGRGDHELFELLAGAVRLCERAPLAKLPRVLTGLEQRFLAWLGVLPDWLHCSHCGRASPQLGVVPRTGALECPEHGGTQGPATPRRARAWLAHLNGLPARAWAEQDPDGDFGDAAALLGRLVERAVERRLRLRDLALQRAGPGSPRHASAR